MASIFINKEELAKKADIPNLFDWSKAKQVDKNYDLDVGNDAQVYFWGSAPKGLSEEFVPYGIVLTIHLISAGKVQFALDTSSNISFRVFGGNPIKWSAWKQIGGVTRHLYTALRKALATSTEMEVA